MNAENWETDPDKLGPLEPLTPEAMREAVNNAAPRHPEPRIVSMARYAALRDIHQLDAGGWECVRCKRHYMIASLTECKA